jgi:hypothetical protein
MDTPNNFCEPPFGLLLTGVSARGGRARDLARNRDNVLTIILTPGTYVASNSSPPATATAAALLSIRREHQQSTLHATRGTAARGMTPTLLRNGRALTPSRTESTDRRSVDNFSMQGPSALRRTNLQCGSAPFNEPILRRTTACRQGSDLKRPKSTWQGPPWDRRPICR